MKMCVCVVCVEKETKTLLKVENKTKQDTKATGSRDGRISICSNVWSQTHNSETLTFLPSEAKSKQHIQARVIKT